MINTVQLKLLPHQFELIDDEKTKIIGLVAGYGSGKSFVVARKAVRLAILNKGHDGIVTEPTYSLLTQILIPELKAALDFFRIPYEFKSGEGIFYCNIQGHETRIICKSMENYERLIGVNAAFVIMDEFDTAKADLAYNAYIKLLGRIRVGNVRQMIIVSTPEGYRAMYRIFVEEMDDNKRLIRAKTTDNHHLPKDYIGTMMSQYPPELIQAYLNGEFTNLTSGTVYTQYDRTLNDTEREDDGVSDIHIGIDFNVGAMSAVACLIKDLKCYAIEEFIGLFDTPEMISVLKERFKNRKVYCYPDAAGNARKSVQASETDIKLLRQAGFTVVVDSKNPAIMDRVNTMNTMFSNALGERKLFINTVKCKKLTKAVEQQAYDEATRLPDKKNGHDNCFSGDTEIFVNGTKMRFDEIPNSGKVLNCFGNYIEYTNGSVRGVRKDMLLLHLSNGKEIKCTSSHEILTTQGWKKAEELRYCQILFRNMENTNGINVEGITLDICEVEKEESYTSKFIKISLGSIQKATTYTTLITTQMTTTLKIWFALALVNILFFMAKIGAKKEKQQQKNLCKELDLLLLSGTNQNKAENGTKSIMTKIKTNFIQKAYLLAKYVEKNMSLLKAHQKAINTAQTIAVRQQEEEAEWMTKEELALFAETNLLSINTQLQKLVVVSVEEITESKEEMTYCLEIEKGHNFILANGAVVSNCGIDALSYLIYKKFPMRGTLDHRNGQPMPTQFKMGDLY